MLHPALLVLADGRFPAGGHAHSGGVEAAVRAGRVHDAGSLEAFCAGRLGTVGLTAAALAASAALGMDLHALDEAAEARTPSPALRATSRRLGRQLLRAARAAWPPTPESALAAVARELPGGGYQPVVFGVVAAAAGLGPAEAATAVAYESVSGPVTACVRLIGLDPFQATAVLARLAGAIGEVAEAAVTAAVMAAEAGDLDLLPTASAPLLDIYAEQHAAWPVRLFAS
ncbi:urease accessory protein [Streptacidiphilus sp. MAP12-20]|uniref:urease accessory protein UreF n=1 Tax=Streptacidiphilus sp. MAP12-20 TaxID=3156299 RepID=UPI003514DD09